MENYIVSARKYRPSTFNSVVGQKALTATLKNAIATHRLAHSYLFCGSRGVGKTSCARIFAKTINCSNPTSDGEACNECDSCRAFNDGNSMNIIELDAASNNGVDDIRQLVEQVQIPPSQGLYRVFIVDEVHMLSAAAFNAFLKTLEEPPSYVIFILATTEKHKIIPTILSRCQIYDFKRITVRDMIDHLSYVASQEGITAETSALNVIARKADGAMRDALSIFDQVAASSRGNITYQSAIENLNVLDYNYYNRLLECFLGGKVLETWLIYKEIRDRGFDSHFFINGLADYLRDLMVARDPSTITLIEADDEARNAMAAEAVKCSPDFIYRAMSLCNDADLNYRTASNKQFLIELTLAKICQLLSPSPNDGGAGEGRLQKINPTATTTTPAPAVVPSATASKPVAPPVQYPTAPPRTPSTVASPTVGYATPRPAGQKRPLVRPTTISINPVKNQNPTDKAEAVQEVVKERNSRYSQEQLNKAWQDFIASRPTEHILINTMRASLPNPIDEPNHKYIIMVENEMQLGIINEAIPAIHEFVRNAIDNDRFTLTVGVNQGAASPHTWTERDVYSHMVEKVPALSDFIKTFDLTLG